MADLAVTQPRHPPPAGPPLHVLEYPIVGHDGNPHKSLLYANIPDLPQSSHGSPETLIAGLQWFWEHLLEEVQVAFPVFFGLINLGSQVFADQLILPAFLSSCNFLLEETEVKVWVAGVCALGRTHHIADLRQHLRETPQHYHPLGMQRVIFQDLGGCQQCPLQGRHKYAVDVSAIFRCLHGAHIHLLNFLEPFLCNPAVDEFRVELKLYLCFIGKWSIRGRPHFVVELGLRMSDEEALDNRMEVQAIRVELAATLHEISAYFFLRFKHIQFQLSPSIEQPNQYSYEILSFYIKPKNAVR